MERAKLFETVFLVLAFLVFVFEAGDRPLRFEQALYFLKRQPIAFL